MAHRHYALGTLVNGMAVGWHAMPSEDEAIKQAHSRSIESPETQCIIFGSGQDDEDAKVEYLVVGGEFYKCHEL